MELADKCKVVCNYHTKRRPYTAKDVGRIVCYAREAGESYKDIMKAIQRCLPSEDCDCERLRATIRTQLVVMTALAVVIGALIPWSRAMQGPAQAALKRVLLDPKLKVMTKAEYEAMLRASKELPKSEELIQRSIGELELALREAFAIGRIIIKE